MGSKPSSTIFRQVQPSLPYSFHYNRLSSSSQSDNQQPLLDKDKNKNKKKNEEEECMEQLKLDIEANWKKNESLEKKYAALERQLCELRATIYKQESRVPPIVETTNVAVAAPTHALEKKIHELKSAVSRLESRSLQVTLGGTGTGTASTGTGSDVVLKKEVDKLAHRVMQLQLDSLMGVRKQEMEKVVRNYVELEIRLTELTTTIDQLKSKSYDETHLTTPMEAEPGIQGHETKDLVSCLIVLIFFSFCSHWC